jgi:putative ABC transport system permease protein
LNLPVELRDAARALVRRPGFALAAMATLALGIGASTAMFAVVDAVLLRPLPIQDPGRVVVMWQADTVRQFPYVELSHPMFRRWRDENTVLTGVAGMASANIAMVLRGRGEPVSLQTRWVTGAFFDLLGVRAHAGRVMALSDDRPGAPRVLVLAHGFWRRQFGGDPAIVGRSVEIDGTPFEVVGVAAPGFEYPKGVEAWTPIAPQMPRLLDDERVFWMELVGRLRPGVSLEEATRDLSRIAERILSAPPHSVPGFRAMLTPITEVLYGPTRPALAALLGAVLLVLLVGCANVAGLLLVRTAERRAEIAMRLALGASRWRIARQVLAESLLLALAGGTLGAALAAAGLQVLVAAAPTDVPRLAEASIDVRVLGFAALCSLVTALLCGLAPMLGARETSLDDALRQGSTRVASRGTPLRRLLIVGEVGATLVLLAGTGLLLRTFDTLRRLDLGYRPEGVLALEVSVPEAEDKDRHTRRPFWQALIQKVEAVPGVASAASVTLRPLWGTVGWDGVYTVEGQSKEDAEKNPVTNFQAVSARYFDVMGIPVRRGRVFAETDTEGRPGVVVLSESLARRHWLGGDPVGKRVKIPSFGSPYHDTWLEVVGVVADTHHREIHAIRPDFYMSYLQADVAQKHLVVRAHGDPLALAPVVREQARQLAPQMPSPDTQTMAAVVSRALGGPRFTVQVFGAFALVAVLLAAMGLYGVLAYSVTRRRREIGVRMALGASPRDVRRLVLGEGLALTLGGLALGLAGAAAGTRLLRSLLFGVTPTDPATLATVSLLILAVAVLACLVPARRASGVDPAVALRTE